MPLSKNKEKYIRSLSIKKYRTQHQNFIAEGNKLAVEILSDPNIQVEAIFAQKTWITKNRSLLNGKKGMVEQITLQQLKTISNLATPNKVLLIVKQPNQSINHEFVSNDWSLYLDGIQDPGNMGTILRIANWFGVKHVFCSPECVDVYNPKVVQSSMGAFLRTQIIEMPFEKLKNTFPDIPVYSTVLQGKSVFSYLPTQQGIIIMGNEGNGISANIQEKSDYQISIPAYGANEMESLNVAVATGIIFSALRNPAVNI